LAYSSSNVLDIWILSRLNRLLKYVHDKVEKYHLYSVLPEMVCFIDEASKWWLRLNSS
jgi:isoleucyl-tRNA synthetase